MTNTSLDTITRPANPQQYQNPEPSQPSGPEPLPERGTTRDAAEILGCSVSLVRLLISTGELRNIERPGRRVYRLDLAEVRDYRRRKMLRCQ